MDYPATPALSSLSLCLSLSIYIYILYWKKDMNGFV